MTAQPTTEAPSKVDPRGASALPTIATHQFDPPPRRSGRALRCAESGGGGFVRAVDERRPAVLACDGRGGGPARAVVRGHLRGRRGRAVRPGHAPSKLNRGQVPRELAQAERDNTMRTIRRERAAPAPVVNQPLAGP